MEREKRCEGRTLLASLAKGGQTKESGGLRYF